ncbi:uncharacterized protein LOC5514576 [Nematostella vectensis]|uniref:uncharacterized protein LOC5514576 n=1 Tax=Nematostella vectensis TaxID=45351 RepID=UPI002077586C|nr:uncharacterized protein LOC5514576 [Nematostella vectensis]
MLAALYVGIAVLAVAQSAGGCNEVAFEPIGCYRDSGRKPQPLTEQLSNDRNAIDWNKWNTLMPEMVCRCAKKALDSGYDTFGIQFYGECWSGPENLLDIDRDGVSTDCIGINYEKCPPGNRTCVGVSGSNFIYKIRQPQCAVEIERVGCFHDDQIPPRPLPLYILNERDPSAESYNGTDVDWNNWNTYMPGFICRCASLSRQRGYKIFSVQFYAECWSGPDARDTYDRNGESSQCVSKNYKPCKPDDKHCVGKQYTNFVYRIVERCDISYTQLGCFKDRLQEPRPLPIMISDEHDSSSRAYNGHLINFKRWDSHIEDMICRCAKRSFGNKYKIFGLQSYGQCWSGEGTRTYRRDGSSDRCITKQFNDCPPGGKHCAGEVAANYIYYITSCSVNFEPIGCYHDDMIIPRPLPDLILSERDSTSPVFNGKRIDWLHWDTYLPEFICRCAERAKELNRTVIGMQFYGECWSGVNGVNTYNRNGNSSNCVGAGFQPCEPGSKGCIGTQETNYVYRIL